MSDVLDTKELDTDVRRELEDIEANNPLPPLSGQGLLIRLGILVVRVLLQIARNTARS